MEVTPVAALACLDSVLWIVPGWWLWSRVGAGFSRHHGGERGAGLELRSRTLQDSRSGVSGPQQSGHLPF